MRFPKNPFIQLGVFMGLFTVLVMGLFFMASTFASLFDQGTRPRIFQAYLADLNGNGRLDALLTYVNAEHMVIINKGQWIAINDGQQGRFTIDRTLYMRSYGLALGDTDGDGRLNAIVTNLDGEETGPMCTEAPPDFAMLPLGAAGSGQYLAARHLKDGRAADFITGCCQGGSFLWNYETFSNASACLGVDNIFGVALADLNGSGSLDAFLAKARVVNEDGRMQERVSNEVWLNDGRGNFTDSGQRLGRAYSMAVVVGDLNGDGTPDAVVGNVGPDEVWLNDGQGNFTDSGQRLGRGLTHALFLADLDGDGSLDLFAVGDTSGRAWLNDGEGRFRAGQRITRLRNKAVALGDLTGDGHNDLLVAGVETYQVWHGTGDGRFTRGVESAYRDER